MWVVLLMVFVAGCSTLDETVPVQAIGAGIDATEACITCDEPTAQPGDECGLDNSGRCVNVTFDVKPEGGMQCRSPYDIVPCE